MGWAVLGFIYTLFLFSSPVHASFQHPYPICRDHVPVDQPSRAERSQEVLAFLAEGYKLASEQMTNSANALAGLRQCLKVADYREENLKSACPDKYLFLADIESQHAAMRRSIALAFSNIQFEGGPKPSLYVNENLNTDIYFPIFGKQEKLSEAERVQVTQVWLHWQESALKDYFFNLRKMQNVDLSSSGLSSEFIQRLLALENSLPLEQKWRKLWQYTGWISTRKVFVSSPDSAEFFIHFGSYVYNYIRVRQMSLKSQLQSLIMQNPILAFMNEREVDLEAIDRAVARLAVNTESIRNDLLDIYRVAHSPDLQGQQKAVTRFLQYSNVAYEVVQGNIAFCGLTADLFRRSENRENAKTIALVAATLAAGFLIPGALGVGAVAAMNFYLVYKSAENLKHLKQRAIAGVNNEGLSVSLVTMRELENEAKQFEVTVAMSAVTLAIPLVRLK